MKLQKAAFLDLASVYRDDLDLTVLKDAVPEWLWFDNISESELANVLAEVDVVVSNKVVLDEAKLRNANHLKLICIAATGTNNVDMDAAKELGITVCNVRESSFVLRNYNFKEKLKLEYLETRMNESACD